MADENASAAPTSDVPTTEQATAETPTTEQPSAEPEPPSELATLVYEAESAAEGVYVSYDEENRDEQEYQEAPWRAELEVERDPFGQFAGLVATAAEGGQAVEKETTCRMIVDGEVVAEATGTPTAFCTAFVFVDVQ